MKENMELINGYVYCDYYGDVHDDTPDPEFEGPQYPNAFGQEYGPPGPGWEIKVNPEYGEGRLWHFTCPGPHHKIYTKPELPIPDDLPQPYKTFLRTVNIAVLTLADPTADPLRDTIRQLEENQ